MGIQILLDKLEKVRKSGDGYVACCPAHADSDPSLALTELPDGRILIHCYAGCPPIAILANLNMELKDLYPEPLGDAIRPLYLARQHKQTVDRERLILALADEDRKRGKKLTAKDLKREREAYMRLKELGHQMV